MDKTDHPKKSPPVSEVLTEDLPDSGLPAPDVQKTSVLRRIGIVLIVVAGFASVYILGKKQTPPAPPVSLSNQPSGNPVYDAATAPPSSSTTLVLPDSVTVSELKFTPFAAYTAEKIPVNPAVPQYSLALADLVNTAAIESAEKNPLTESQKVSVTNSHFVIRPGILPYTNTRETGVDPDTRIDDMADTYRLIGGEYAIWKRKPENAVFITTDYLLHLYHRFIDLAFKEIETTKFQPALQQLSHDMSELALQGAEKSADPETKASFRRVAAYFIVSSVLLDTSKPKISSFNPQAVENDETSDETVDSAATAQKNLERYGTRIPKDLYGKIAAEINLIFAAKNPAPSPLYDTFRSKAGLSNPEDYTQYKPRSHYAETSVLRSYFRAMMWYGRQGFLTGSTELTRDALIITYLMQGASQTTPFMQAWENIYLPTVFFVGKSDDLTLYDYRTAMQSAYGTRIPFTDLGNSQKFTKFAAAVSALKGPAIMGDVFAGDDVFSLTKSELQNKTKGFRFMGQRFIPDSYMFSSLTQGNEKPDAETGQSLPSTPTALMIMSVLGSKAADTELESWVSSHAPDSDKVIAKVMTKLQNEFGRLAEPDWTQNIYWTWLYSIKSLFGSNLSGYPPFMQKSNWGYKSLNTALGSWTELRHDTLLYAKQSYAEKGGGGETPEPPPVPKGYVEPNPVFFERFRALVAMTDEGLSGRNLLNDELRGRLKNFRESVTFLQGLAVKELENRTITDAEYERLRKMGYETPRLIYPLAGAVMYEKDARAALIADVHTDAAAGHILYEATGKPNIIYVAVKDQGGTRLTRGVVYNYFEFTGPLGERMNDEEWQSAVYENKRPLPQSPQWLHYLTQP